MCDVCAHACVCMCVCVCVHAYVCAQMRSKKGTWIKVVIKPVTNDDTKQHC